MTTKELESIINYRDFILKIDVTINDIKAEYHDDINCRESCCDCCNNVFNISIIEGYYLQQGFKELSPDVKDKVINNILNIKAAIENNPENKETIKCPLLSEQKCTLYNFRPIVCRTFGYPMLEERTGQIATCPKNFTSMRDREYTLKTISTGLISANCVVLSQFLLKELGKDFPDSYIPPLYSILEVMGVFPE